MDEYKLYFIKMQSVALLYLKVGFFSRKYYLFYFMKIARRAFISTIK